MKSVVIAAGHSDTDPGAVHNGVKEADLTLRLREITASKLRLRGIDVRTDGPPGVNWPLNKALTLIPGSALAVELHCNASASATANGTEALSLPRLKRESQALAAAASEALGTALRGDKGWQDMSVSPRGTLAWVSAGGIVLETHFISNVKDMGAWSQKHWLLASALTEAIARLITSDIK